MVLFGAPHRTRHEKVSADRAKTTPRAEGKTPPRARISGRRTTVAFIALATAASLTAAACSANNSGTTNNSSKGSDVINKNAPALKYTPCCSWDTSNFSYNRYNTTQIATAMDNWVTIPLAIAKFPSITDYAPMLAQSWSADNGVLTVKLQPDAKWDDGTPVTSKDLYDTVMLDGLNGAAEWNDITDVKVVDDHTVAFTLRKGEPVPLAESDILGIVTQASSVYGKFITPQVESDIKAYYAKYATDPAAAVKMPENTRNAAAFQKMAAFDPKKIVGDGPFKLVAANGAEADLEKSSTFFWADKIKVQKVTYGNMSNQQIYPQLFSGGLDFSNVYLSPPLLKKWQATKGSQLALPQGFGFAIIFNNAVYPLNLTPVRQALAYVIPRQAMTDAAYGSDKGAGGVAQTLQTGLSPLQNQTALTDAQRQQLNPYNLDPAKATELLKGAGFTQKDGQWYTPKGKQFTLTFEANSGTSDIVTSFTSAAKALTAFGIKSDVNAVSGAQLTADQMNGNFQALSAFLGALNTPLITLSSVLHDSNYQTSGNYAGKRGMGFGPTMNVPGLGTVDVATTIYQQSRNVGPGDQMNKLTWDWVQLVNQQVPYLWYASKVYQFPFNDTHYTNWPPMDDSGTSPLWNIVGVNMNGGLLYAMTQGYIQPK